jgi:hypothetical protein
MNEKLLITNNTVLQNFYISQASAKVWHTQVQRLSLPLNYSLILKSYLHSRNFLKTVETKYTKLLPVNVNLPQGSVLGPSLYLLNTADLPTSPESTTANFVEDTAVVATDSDPAIAAQKLQTKLFAMQDTKRNMPQVRVNFVHLPKKKMSSSPGYTLSGDLPGTNTFSQNGNN